ncbi:MAG: hypothetical protein RBS29_08935, partial [Bacteroidales bacterium]|nr:hypothetical protein [Bacteroidales bacterium]
RPVPKDPWWEYVWSDWAPALVGPRGHILIGNPDFPTQAPNGSKVWVCYHVDNSFSILSNKPSHSSFPSLLFSSKPHCSFPLLLTARHFLQKRLFFAGAITRIALL